MGRTSRTHRTFGNYPLDVGRRIRYFGAGWHTEYMVLHELAQTKDCVGFLFGALPGQDEPDPQGTCFFVDWWEDDKAHGPYLVTAKHVLRDLRNGDKGFLRVTNPEGGTETIELDLSPDQWMIHDDNSVDLAVQHWTRERWQGHPSDLVHWPLTSLMLPGIQHLRADQPMGTVAFEGDDAVFVGLMRDFPGVKKNLPMLRNGMIGLVPDEPIHGGYGASEYIVLNAQSYKGNSGAPVFLYWGSFFLIGVLTHAFYEEADRAVREGRAERHYNLGVSLVTPIPKVEDILNSDKEKTRRSRSARPLQGEPLSGAAAPFTKDAMEAALRKVSRPNGKAVTEKREQASSET